MSKFTYIYMIYLNYRYDKKEINHFLSIVEETHNKDKNKLLPRVVSSDNKKQQINEQGNNNNNNNNSPNNQVKDDNVIIQVPSS